MAIDPGGAFARVRFYGIADARSKDYFACLARAVGVRVSAVIIDFQKRLVTHGDSLEILRRLPTGCARLIFADPPYFLSNGGTTVKSGRRVSVDKGAWDVGQDAHRILAWHEAWLRCAQRVLHPDGSIWISTTAHSLFAIGFALQRCSFRLLNDVTWEKPNPPPNLARRTFTHSTEHLLWAAPSTSSRYHFAYATLRKENGGKQVKDVWRYTAPLKDEKAGPWRHPTQKPIALLRRIVAACARPDDLVIDPFCGSGTTGVAALAAGCRFIGIDSDKKYVTGAIARLEEVRHGRGNDRAARRRGRGSHGRARAPQHPARAPRARRRVDA